MASKKSMPPSLAEDTILFEIFPRLPAKSIHRFRCVSTSCRRLLTSDHQFLSAFRRLSRRRYLLSFYFHPPLELALYSFDRSCAASPVADAGEPQNPSVFSNCYAKIINGLMFTFQPGHKPTVSNLATNETFQLPPVPVLPSSHYKMCFYFCHDPDMDTYKVLRTAVAKRRGDYDPVRMKCSIFTLGALSSWRNYSLRRFKQLGDSKSVCINGTLYLTRFCLNNNTAVVICAFVVDTEHFYAVGYPTGLSPSRYGDCHLIELKGALAVIDIGKDLSNCEIKLWVKEKGRVTYGDHESWTEVRIGFDLRWETTFRLLAKSFCFSTNFDGEIMMGATGWSAKDGCWIFIYNVDKGEWRRVEMQGLGGDQRIVSKLFVEEYSESPITLKQILNKDLAS